MKRRTLLEGMTLMPFGNQRTGFSNPPVSLVGFNQIINRSGIFVYSGPPAPGNLVFSVASAGGTDKFGNVYQGPGAFSYINPSGAYAALSLNKLLLASALTGPTAEISGGGGSMLVSTGVSGGPGDHDIGITLLSRALSVSGNQGQVCIAEDTPNPVTGRMAEIHGDAVASLLQSWHPGAVGTTEETWQSMTTRGYQNGWTDSGNNPPGRWRLTASPANWVQVQGSLFTPATPPDGQVVLNIPAVYHPAASHSNFSGRLVCPANAAVQARLSMGSTGNLTIAGASALAANTELVIPEGSGYSLD